MGPGIANVFSSITNKMERHTIYLFFVKCSTCFRRFLRPSSGAQNCIYCIGYLVNPLLLPATIVAGSSKGLTRYPMQYIQFWALDDGRRNRLKHVEHFTKNKQIVWRCILLVILENNINSTRHLSSNTRTSLGYWAVYVFSFFGFRHFDNTTGPLLAQGQLKITKFLHFK